MWKGEEGHLGATLSMRQAELGLRCLQKLVGTASLGNAWINQRQIVPQVDDEVNAGLGNTDRNGRR